MAGIEVAVGTFNIRHGVGTDARLDCARTAAAIARMDVDVAGLQEVDRRWSERSTFADQARYLAEHLGVRLAFGASLWRRGEPGTRGEYGVALLSRHPVLRTRSTLLPCPRGGEQRSLLEAAVEVDGVVLRCLCTHLQHSSPAERRAQAAAIAGAVTGAPGDRYVPTVLLGDLNAGPGTPEVGTLTGRLADAWAVAGEGAGHTYPTAGPRVRIDYVLTSPGIEVQRARVVDTDASDHLPVTARLRLRPPCEPGAAP